MWYEAKAWLKLETDLGAGASASSGKWLSILRGANFQTKTTNLKPSKVVLGSVFSFVGFAQNQIHIAVDFVTVQVETAAVRTRFLDEAEA